MEEDEREKFKEAIPTSDLAMMWCQEPGAEGDRYLGPRFSDRSPLASPQVHAKGDSRKPGARLREEETFGVWLSTMRFSLRRTKLSSNRWFGETVKDDTAFFSALAKWDHCRGLNSDVLSGGFPLGCQVKRSFWMIFDAGVRPGALFAGSVWVRKRSKTRAPVWRSDRRR